MNKDLFPNTLPPVSPLIGIKIILERDADLDRQCHDGVCAIAAVTAQTCRRMRHLWPTQVLVGQGSHKLCRTPRSVVRQADKADCRAYIAGAAMISAAEFLREYFYGAEGDLYVCAYRNSNSELSRGQVDRRVTRDPKIITEFIADLDKPEREVGVYFCCATLKPDKCNREGESISQAPSLIADIDDKNHELTRDEVLERLDQLDYPPSVVVNSGHGFQAHWLLGAPCKHHARVVAARKKIQALTASDSVHDIPRVLRLPDTHNSKKPGEWLPVHVVRWNPSYRYPLRELVRWLRTAETIIPAKPTAPPQTNGLRYHYAPPTQYGGQSEGQRIREALNYIRPSPDDYDTFIRIGMALKNELGEPGLEIWDEWCQQCPEKYDRKGLEIHWRSFKGDGVGIGTLFHIAKQYGYAAQREVGSLEDAEQALRQAYKRNGRAFHGQPTEQLQIGNETAAEAPASPKLMLFNAAGAAQAFDPDTAREEPPSKKEFAPPLPLVNISNWDHEPAPEQEWGVEDVIPLRQTTLFSGEGGYGKSTLLQHLMGAASISHTVARDWVGFLPAPGASLLIECEDGEDAIHRRLDHVARHYGVSIKEMENGGLKLMSFAGKDAVLAALTRSGRIETTALYNQILEFVGDVKPKLIGIASSANVFAGSEVDRSQVQHFVNQLTRLAIVANGSVILASHPSLTGINSGSGSSGSTQWHNAVRARMYLTSPKPESGEPADSDLRELTFKKNQYGPISTSRVLRYQNGLFLPVPGVGNLDKVAAEAKADDVFMGLLRRFTAEGRNVSHHATGKNYAPTAFAREDEGKKAGIRKADFEGALRRLFKAQKIMVEQYGKPSNPHDRLKER